MLAAACGVPIAAGAVCWGRDDAAAAMRELLDRAVAVVVKQAHNGAGAGNELVLRDAGLATDHVGSRHLHQLDGARDDVDRYWSTRWEWASAGGRFPVVIEEFEPHAVSAYSEHHVTDRGTRPTEAGTLHYAGRRLSHQIVPLRGVDGATRAQLLDGGTRLAERYRSLGYRGHLSADAVVRPSGGVVFTEVNAQVSGSLHIYDVIVHRVVGTDRLPERSVVEYHVPPTWAVPSFDTFLTQVSALGHAYDPVTRTGVIVSMPVIRVESGRSRFVFCVAFARDEDRHAVWAAPDERFADRPCAFAGSSGAQPVVPRPVRYDHRSR